LGKTERDSALRDPIHTKGDQKTLGGCVTRKLSK